MTKRKNPEYILTKNVATWLALALHGTGVAFTHFPAGENRTAATGAKLKRMGLKPGWPDFIFIIPFLSGFSTKGTFVGIEMKAGRGQSASQKITQKQIEEAGGYYYLASSISEVAGYLRGHGVKLKARAV